MRTHHRIFVISALLLAGCSAPSDPAPFQTATEGSLLTRLEADTGSPWTAASSLTRNVARTLVPIRSARFSGDPPIARAHAFFERYAADLGGNVAELSNEQADVLPDGSTVVSFRHFVPGTTYPVFEAASALRTASDGELIVAESGFGLDTSGTARAATLSEARAVDVARAAVATECGEPSSGAADTALGGHVVDDESVVLAYRVDLGTAGVCVAPRVFVDAVTGKASQVFDRAPRLTDRSRGGRSYLYADTTDIKTFDVSPTANGYFLRTTTAPQVTTKAFGSSDPVFASSLGAWDVPDWGLSVDAHAHTSKALAFFQRTFGHDGVDGRGSGIDVVVHDKNAAHTGSYNPVSRSIHFGDGGTVSVLLPNATFRKVTTVPMQLAYDGVVHELAHGVALATSGFVYYGEAAAIHESFADVMGTAAKLLDPETSEGATFDFADVAMANRRGGRSLLHPERDGSIATYAKIPKCLLGTVLNDFCFAHASAGIGNRAFAMMVAGGEELTSNGYRYAVPAPIPVYEASRIWFDSVTRMKSSRPTFAELATAQIKLASMRGLGELQAVACAWLAVGVVPPSAETLWGVTCRASRSVPKSPSCSGMADGTWLCDENSPNAAFQCRGGAIASGTSCPNTFHRCIQATPSNFVARLDARGSLLCK